MSALRPTSCDRGSRCVKAYRAFAAPTSARTGRAQRRKPAGFLSVAPRRRGEGMAEKVGGGAWVTHCSSLITTSSDPRAGKNDAKDAEESPPLPECNASAFASAPGRGPSTR